MGFFSKLKKLWQIENSLSSESKPDTGTLLPSPSLSEEWRTQMKSALTLPSPHVADWVGLILPGGENIGPLVWDRLRYVFSELNVPSKEASLFIERFRSWIEMNNANQIEDLRSELQYRFNLALELENEDAGKALAFSKLDQGLTKTKQGFFQRIGQLLAGTPQLNQSFWDELEEILVMSDVGVSATGKLLELMRAKAKKDNITDPQAFKALFRSELAALFPKPKKTSVPEPPEVVMVIGVNGVGKTTSIAKLAHRAQLQGRKVLLAAGDTFRAAAVEQLEIWSKRVGTGFFGKEHGADPGAVAFEAMEAAQQGGYDLVFFDTAGRLHTKTDLMDELKKVHRVMAKKLSSAPHRIILVVDATTGQNALSQAKLFSQAVPVDEVILTKLDGTAKGGIIVALAIDFGLPISFVGLGEKMEDMRPFDGQDFVRALIG